MTMVINVTTVGRGALVITVININIVTIGT